MMRAIKELALMKESSASTLFAVVYGDHSF